MRFLGIVPRHSHLKARSGPMVPFAKTNCKISDATSEGTDEELDGCHSPILSAFLDGLIDDQSVIASRDFQGDAVQPINHEGFMMSFAS